MNTNFTIRTTYDEFQRSTTIVTKRKFVTSLLIYDLCTVESLPAIYQIGNTPTEPSRLQVTPSQPQLATPVLVSREGVICVPAVHLTFSGVPWLFL